MTKGLILFTWGSLLTAIMGLGMVLLPTKDAMVYLVFVLLGTIFSLIVAAHHMIKE